MAKMPKKNKILTKTSTKVSFFFRDVNSTLIFDTTQDIDTKVDFVPPEVNSELLVNNDGKGARGTVVSVFRQLDFDSGGNLAEFISVSCKNATLT